jgi:hypothetical protein
MKELLKNSEITLTVGKNSVEAMPTIVLLFLQRADPNPVP